MATQGRLGAELRNRRVKGLGCYPIFDSRVSCQLSVVGVWLGPDGAQRISPVLLIEVPQVAGLG